MKYLIILCLFLHVWWSHSFIGNNSEIMIQKGNGIVIGSGSISKYGEDIIEGSLCLRNQKTGEIEWIDTDWITKSEWQEE